MNYLFLGFLHHPWEVKNHFWLQKLVVLLHGFAQPWSTGCGSNRFWEKNDGFILPKRFCLFEGLDKKKTWYLLRALDPQPHGLIFPAFTPNIDSPQKVQSNRKSPHRRIPLKVNKRKKKNSANAPLKLLQATRLPAGRAIFLSLLKASV